MYWDDSDKTLNKLLAKTDFRTIGIGCNRVGTTTPPTNNFESIYQQGNVGVGYTSITNSLGAKLDVIW